MNRIEISQGRPLRKVKSVLCQAVVLIFTLFSFSGLTASEIDTVSFPQNSQASIYTSKSTALSVQLKPASTKTEGIIYMSPGATLFGQEHISVNSSKVKIFVAERTMLHGRSKISNAKIVQLPVVVSSEKTGVDVSNTIGGLRQFVVVNKGTDTALIKSQRKIVEKVNNTFYSCKERKQSIFLAKTEFLSGVVSSTSSVSSHFSSEVFVVNGIIYDYESKVKNQKFYTSESKLHLHFVNNSFLRGPPQLVAQS